MWLLDTQERQSLLSGAHSGKRALESPAASAGRVSSRTPSDASLPQGLAQHLSRFRSVAAGFEALMQFACHGKWNRTVDAIEKVIRHGDLRRFSMQPHRASNGTADDDAGEHTHQEDHEDHGDAPDRTG
jgi:hypothetical protein